VLVGDGVIPGEVVDETIPEAVGLWIVAVLVKRFRKIVVGVIVA
jgi:hypothetical protein